MLTLQIIRETPDFVVERLAVKGFDGRAVITEILEIDAERRKLQQKTDSDQSQLKKLASSIGALMKEGKKEEAENIKQEVARIKGEAAGLHERLEECEHRMTELLLTVPNLPNENVPEGLTAEENVVEQTGGVIPQLAEDALPHWDLAKKYNLIDFELGVKVTGAVFPFYIG